MLTNRSANFPPPALMELVLTVDVKKEISRLVSFFLNKQQIVNI